MSTEAKKLTDDELEMIRKHFTTPSYPSSDPTGCANALLNHIDALTAENAAQQAELVRLKSCEGVDVERLAKEIYELENAEDLKNFGEEQACSEPFEKLHECERETKRIIVRHIVNMTNGSRQAQQPRPLADSEVERLAEGVREIRLAGSLPMTWEDAGEDIREGYRSSVRYLAAELRTVESAELAELRAKLMEAEKNGARWEGEVMAITSAANSADITFQRLGTELKVVNLAADELRAKLESQVGIASDLQYRFDQMKQRAEAAEREREEAAFELQAAHKVLGDAKVRGLNQDCESINVPTRISMLWHRLEADCDRLADELADSRNCFASLLEQLAPEVVPRDTCRGAAGQMFNVHARMAGELASRTAELAAAKRELEDYKKGAAAEAAAHEDACVLLDESREQASSWKMLYGVSRQQLAETRAKLDRLARACDAVAKAEEDCRLNCDQGYEEFRHCHNAMRAARSEYLAALAAAKCDEPKTRDFAEVIRRQAADDPALAAGIAQAEDDADREQAEFAAAAEIIERHGYRVISDSLEEPGHSSDAGKMVDAEQPAFSDFCHNRARSQAAGYAARGEQVPTLGSKVAFQFDDRSKHSVESLKARGIEVCMIPSPLEPFVCPKCGGTEYTNWRSWMGQGVECVTCTHRCTWADVRAAREPAQPTGEFVKAATVYVP